jgi:hypothetical protein
MPAVFTAAAKDEFSNGILFLEDACLFIFLSQFWHETLLESIPQNCVHTKESVFCVSVSVLRVNKCVSVAATEPAMETGIPILEVTDSVFRELDSVMGTDEFALNCGSTLEPNTVSDFTAWQFKSDDTNDLEREGDTVESKGLIIGSEQTLSRSPCPKPEMLLL